MKHELLVFLKADCITIRKHFIEGEELTAYLRNLISEINNNCEITIITNEQFTANDCSIETNFIFKRKDIDFIQVTHYSN